MVALDIRSETLLSSIYAIPRFFRVPGVYDQNLKFTIEWTDTSDE